MNRLHFARSEWQLSTTLERAGCEGMSFAAYYQRAVARVRPAVETFTGIVPRSVTGGAENTLKVMLEPLRNSQQAMRAVA
jgi:hypothetical protein